MNKFHFPIFTRVLIRNCSLYKKRDCLDIDLRKDVYCLAGANGLGKSTFITLLNYGLTGVCFEILCKMLYKELLISFCLRSILYFHYANSIKTI